MCTHRFTLENTTHFPSELQNLIAGNSVPDVHTCLRVETPAGWMTVDATWPSSAASLGMPVNQTFKAGLDMAIACNPIDYYPVPEGQDPPNLQRTNHRRFLRRQQPGAGPVHRRDEPVVERKDVELGK